MPRMAQSAQMSRPPRMDGVEPIHKLFTIYLLTNQLLYSIIIVSRGQWERLDCRVERVSKSSTDELKIFQKSLKNLLTNNQKCAIISTQR
jgi:hypothetical protein